MRRVADVNVRPGGHPTDSRSERQKGYAVVTEVFDQGFALGAIGMHRNVDRVAMIKPQAVVRRRLPQGANRKLPAKS